MNQPQEQEDPAKGGEDWRVRFDQQFIGPMLFEADVKSFINEELAAARGEEAERCMLHDVTAREEGAREERERVREWVRTNLFTEGISPKDSRHCERIAALESAPLMQMHQVLDYSNSQRNKVAQDLINFLSTPQEPRHGGGRG